MKLFEKLKLSTAFLHSGLGEYKRFSAFTLSEILITLGIIGVVAALTIPTLINNYKEQTYNVGVNKVYSMLSQALLQIKVNNGGSVDVGVVNSNGLRSQFCSVFSCIKNDTAENIFGINKGNYKFYKGNVVSGYVDSGVNDPAAVLNNGMFFKFRDNGGCSFGVNACAWLDVDINGASGPNEFGKDFYRFWITKKNNDDAYAILPVGTSNEAWSTNCTAGSTTWQSSNSCTYLRLNNPSQMP